MAKYKDSTMVFKRDFDELTLKEFLQQYYDIGDQEWNELDYSMRKVLQHRATLVSLDEEHKMASNGYLIWRTMDDDQKDEFSDTEDPPYDFDFPGQNPDDIPVPQGAKLYIPNDLVDRVKKTVDYELTTSPTLSVNDKKGGFFSEQVEGIIEDEEYVPEERVEVAQQNLNTGQHKANFHKRVQHIDVKIYAKAFAEDDTEKAKTINATPFVISCTTQVHRQGGTFQLELTPVPSVHQGEDKKRVVEGRQTLAGELKVPVEAGSASASEWVLDKEKLQVTPEGFFTKEFLESVDRTGELKRPIYMFHHLIQSQDVVAIKFEKLERERGDRKESYKNDDFWKIEKDIWKVIEGDTLDMIGLVDDVNLVEDSASGAAKVSINGTDLSKLLSRDGLHFYPGAASDVAQGEVNFNSFFWVNDTEEIKESAVYERLSSGKRVQGRFADVNLWKPQRIRYWVDFILSKVGLASVTGEDNVDPSFAGSDDPRRGVYQKFRAVVDPNLNNRQVVDSSLATNRGNAFSFLKRIVQAPFAEMWTDTYGDDYYLIARKPPFNKEDFLNNYTIDIESEQVKKVDLSFDEQSAYSWYKLTPALWYQGGDGSMSSYYFIGAFFPEMADIFGSRPYELRDMYLENPIDGKRNGFMQAQSFEDLKWVVQTTVHLPFTRKGTITIKRDRRIKRGMNVFLKSTGELFYVDGVSQNHAVSKDTMSATTTLSVVRGIVRKHANAYFGLVRMNTLQEEEVETSLDRTENIDLAEENIGVGVIGRTMAKRTLQFNKEKLDFLFRRKQFSDRSQPFQD